jgi:hypothetical protein
LQLKRERPGSGLPIENNNLKGTEDSAKVRTLYKKLTFQLLQKQK